MTVVDTRACRMTPEGRGAIATVLVWGPQAIACVAQQFQSRSGITLESAPAGRILFGMWSSNATPSQEVVSEEVVVCQTENDQVEVHCHGGHAAANAILAVLRTRGCRIVEWTDLPAMDRIQQDVRRALAVARTETVAAILIDQQRGALADVLEQIEQSLDGDDRPTARDLLAELLQYEKLGCRLTSPWRVAIVGPPNVGKSSLINAIVGFQRAIVFDAPGTTRDVVTASTAINGWPVDFADTAGIRATEDTIEKAGVARSFEQLRLSDLMIVVLDATAPLSNPISTLLDEFPAALVVLNKIDLVRSPPDLPRVTRATSATRGDGISDLLSDITQHLISQAPPPGTAIPFTPEQFNELRAIQSALDDEQPQLARSGLRRFRSSRIP